jgi:hypothetical protein
MPVRSYSKVMQLIASWVRRRLFSFIAVSRFFDGGRSGKYQALAFLAIVF